MCSRSLCSLNNPVRSLCNTGRELHTVIVAWWISGELAGWLITLVIERPFGTERSHVKRQTYSCCWV